MEDIQLQAEKVLKEIIKLIWGFDMKITSKQNERGIFLSLVPENSSQASVVIGLKGRNIGSLRNLIKAWGAIHKTRVFIEPLIKK